MDLSRYAFEALRKDQEFILYRGQSEDASQVLVLAPAVQRPRPEGLNRLQHEYSLKEELDPCWATRPIAMAHHWDRPALLLMDPGGVPLSQLLGPLRSDLDEHSRVASASADAGEQPLALEFSLRLGISLSIAISHSHQCGLIHKDIKPANVLVNSETDQCRLTGFGIASRLPRERQSPEPPEVIAGTLAYMAPEQTGRDEPLD